MAKDAEKILSSLPLQIVLYFNGFYAGLYVVVAVILFIYKQYRLPYPPNVFGEEIAGLILLAFVEFSRLRLASRGNRMQQVTPLLLAILVTGPALVGYFYFLKWQTYILNLDVYMNGACIAFACCEVLLALYATMTFLQHSSTA